MESRNGKSVILTDDGIFRTVDGTYEVGSEFKYKEPIRSRKMASRIAAAAACLLMALSMGTYSYQNFTVYATVTLTGTTPIQLQLNRHDKVIGVKAVDKSGEALAEQLIDSGIKGEYLQDAVAKAEKMMQAQNKDGEKTAGLPQVQCKSPDKQKAISDMLHQEETTGTTAQEPSKDTKTDTTTTTAAAAADPEGDSGFGAQSSQTGTSETVTTTTQPSASAPTTGEGMTPQETTGGDEGEGMTAQEVTADETGAEAETSAAAETAPTAAATSAPAPAADETMPAAE